jgi:tetratricopeptide (TPR) repeat protein
VEGVEIQGVNAGFQQAMERTELFVLIFLESTGYDAARFVLSWNERMRAVVPHKAVPRRWASFSFLLALLLGFSIPLYAQEIPPELPALTYDLFFSKALSHINQKKYEESVQELTQALAAKPDDAGAMHYLGVALGRLGRYAEAEAFLLKARKGDPYDDKVYFDLGVVEYRLEKYTEALRAFDLAESVDDVNGAMIHYYQGLALHRLREYERAAPRFLRAVSLAPELGLTAHYYAGVGRYRLGRWDEAADQFNRAIQIDPSSKVAASAQQFLAAMGAHTEKGKRWHISLRPAYQYDSNVALLTKDSALPSGISDKSDRRFVLYAKAGLQVAETEQGGLDVGYAFYQSLHSRLSNFDVQNHEADASITFNRNRPKRLHLPYSFNYARVGGDTFSFSHTLKPTLVVRRSPSVSRRFQVGVERNDFSNTLFFPLNDERDGTRYLAGISQSGTLAGRGQIQAGYEYSQNETGDTPTEDDWAYQGHAASGVLRMPAWGGIWMDLLADYKLHRYQHANSVSSTGDRRVDRIQGYTATLSRAVAGRVTLALQYLFNRNQSNIEVFDYDRHVISVIVSADF